MSESQDSVTLQQVIKRIEAVEDKLNLLIKQQRYDRMSRHLSEKLAQQRMDHDIENRKRDAHDREIRQILRGH